MTEPAPIRPSLERALDSYRRAPESRWFAPLADAYRASGQLEEAVRVLRTGLERHPRYVSAQVLLGLCLRDLHEDDAAETCFARVLELDAENLVALRHRAEVARRRGSLDRAVELLRQILEADPFDREVQADLGLLTTALERRARDAREAQAPPPVPAPPPAANVPPAELDPAAIDPFFMPSPSAARIERPFAPPPAESPFTWPPSPPIERSFTPPPGIAAERPFTLPPPSAPEAPFAWPPTPETLAPEPLARGVSPATPWTPVAEPPPPIWTPPAANEPTDARLDSETPPPPIDLRRVGRGTPGGETASGPTPLFPGLLGAPENAGAAPPEDPSWQVTRQDDRIVVSPWDVPVRGPIRSVEDRLWSEQHASHAAEPPLPPPSPVVPQAAPPPASPVGAAEPAPSAEFATLTLARIYESQGYVQKALGIYDELHRKHPQDVEIAARLAALQRRLAGMPGGETPPQPPPIAAPPPVGRAAAPEAISPPPDSEWRLLDAAALGAPQETAERLRQLTRDVRDQDRGRRHTVLGSPPPPPPPPAAPLPGPESTEPETEDLSRGHADFQRFLSYVRSLKP